MPSDVNVYEYDAGFGYHMWFTATSFDAADAFVRDTLTLDATDDVTITLVPPDKVLRVGIGEPGEFRRGDPETEGASFDETGYPYIEQTAEEWAVGGPERIIAEKGA